MGEDEAALLAALGLSWIHAGEQRPGVQSLLRAIALYRERGDGLGLARAVRPVVRGVSGHLLGPEREIALLDEAVAALGVRDPHLEAHLLLHRAGIDWDEVAEGAAARGAALAAAHGYSDVEITVWYREAHRAREALRFNDAEAAARTALRAFELSGTLHPLGAPAVLTSSLINAGRLNDADAAAGEWVTHFRRVRIRPNEWSNLAVQAYVALLRCDFERFGSLVEEVPGESIGWSVLRAIRRELAGDVEGALTLLPRPDAAETAAPERRSPDPRGLIRTADVEGDELAQSDPRAVAGLHGTRARLLFHAGDVVGARHELSAWAGGLPTRMGFVAREQWLAAVGDVLPALGDDDLVSAAYQEVAVWQSARLANNNLIPSILGFDTLRGALALRLGLIDEAEGHYRTGLEWAERERCPIEQGRCLQGLAEVAERRGQHREAMPFLDRAGALFQQHGATSYLKQVLAKKEILRA